MLTAGAVQASASLSNVQPAHVEIDAAPVAVVNRAIVAVDHPGQRAGANGRACGYADRPP